MRAGVQGANFHYLPRIDAGIGLPPDTARRPVGADAAKQIGHRLGVARRAEKGLNARSGEDWKTFKYRKRREE